MEDQMTETTSNQLAIYNPHRATLAELKEANKSIIFNYDTTAGEKEARSHIYKLRQSKTAVDRVRETEKREVLERGRLIDSEAKEIIAELDAMIDIHAKPIREKEERNKKRIAAIQEKIGHIAGFLECRNCNIQDLEAGIAYLDKYPVDETFEEFMAEALNTKNAALKAQRDELEIATKREMERQELECLRKEQAEREQRDRDAKIAQEAAQRATEAAQAKAEAERVQAEQAAQAERAAAEAKAAKEREEAARREREAIEAKEQAERQAAADKAAAEKAIRDAEAAEKQRELDAIAAREKAERDIAEAEERARRKLEQEAQESHLREQERAANKKHQEEIHSAIIAGMSACGVDEAATVAMISAIIREQVPHVKIIY